ncbi:MAG: class IV adenylate cyclase [Phycisphaerales bacterium]|jgi:adenylate cyclase class 2|nr:class IV adenylate cyclase [Phycisphaerales bacterium]
MPLEIEAKMKVNDLEAVRGRLQAVGAACAGRFLETNTFFDTEDRSLLAADKGLRLRINRDLAGQGEQYILTFKGPRLHGSLKTRQEQELMVVEADSAVEFLLQLGYAPVLRFEKRRERWELDHCHVELDEMPYLGCYVEIEGPSEQAVLEVRSRLQLADRPLVRASYIGLLMSHLQENNLPQREIVFPATDPSATEG